MLRMSRSVWCYVSLTLSGLVFGVTPEQAKAYALPVALEARLDTFFKEHAEDFNIQGADSFSLAWQKLKADKASPEEEMRFVATVANSLLPAYDSLGRKLLKAGCTILNFDEKSIVFLAPGVEGHVIKMPGWLFRVLKGEEQHNLLRLDGAAMIRRSVEAHGFSSLVQTPVKYLYHLPWRGNDLNDSNFIVVAEGVALGSGEVMDPAPASLTTLALLTMVTETGQNDLHAENLHRRADGVFIIVDTAEFFPFTPNAIRDYCLEHKDQVVALSEAIHRTVAHGTDQEITMLVPVFKKVYAVLETIPSLVRSIRASNQFVPQIYLADLEEDIRAYPGEASRHESLLLVAKILKDLLHHDPLVETCFQYQPR